MRPAAQGSQDFLKRQLAVTGVLPDNSTIIVEHFLDETGNHQMMVPLGLWTQGKRTSGHPYGGVC